MLNIQKIFEAQEKLDNEIVKVHSLKDKSLTGDITQALYVELGELAQEIGFFKYWKKNKTINKTRQYDEWADCMHFMASLGNKYGHSEDIISVLEMHHIDGDFNVVSFSNSYHELFDLIYRADLNNFHPYCNSLNALIKIGLKLGMTFEDMRKAYSEKNQVNYERLASGY